MDCPSIASAIGRRALFVGLESIVWTPMAFAGLAQFARSHSIDTLFVKVADGTNVWYGGIGGYRARCNAIKAEGVGVVPYTYSYGDKFGALNQEIAILSDFLQEDGVVCMDAEAEWNGQAD